VFRPRVKKLEDDSRMIPPTGCRHGEVTALGEEIPIGKFFERTDVSTLHGAEPVLKQWPWSMAI